MRGEEPGLYGAAHPEEWEGGEERESSGNPGAITPEEKIEMSGPWAPQQRKEEKVAARSLDFDAVAPEEWEGRKERESSGNPGAIAPRKKMRCMAPGPPAGK